MYRAKDRAKDDAWNMDKGKYRAKDDKLIEERIEEQRLMNG